MATSDLREPTLEPSMDGPSDATELDRSEESSTTSLYRAAIGPIGTGFYLPIFNRFEAADRGGISWNWPASLATLNWLAFRKLWSAALAYAGAAVGLALLVFGIGRLVFRFSEPIETRAAGGLPGGDGGRARPVRQRAAACRLPQAHGPCTGGQHHAARSLRNAGAPGSVAQPADRTGRRQPADVGCGDGGVPEFPRGRQFAERHLERPGHHRPAGHARCSLSTGTRGCTCTCIRALACTGTGRFGTAARSATGQCPSAAGQWLRCGGHGCRVCAQSQRICPEACSPRQRALRKPPPRKSRHLPKYRRHCLPKQPAQRAAGWP